KNIEDPWMQIAALSASPERALQLFKSAREFTGQDTEARRGFMRQVTGVIAARRKPEEIRQVLQTVVQTSTPGSEWWRLASLQGLAGGRGGRGGRGGGRGAAAASPENMGHDLLVKLYLRPALPIRTTHLRL